LHRNDQTYFIVKLKNGKNQTEIKSFENIVMKITSEEIDKNGKNIVRIINKESDIEHLKKFIPSAVMVNTYVFEMNSTFKSK
jgi:hypothetical protein